MIPEAVEKAELRREPNCCSDSEKTAHSDESRHEAPESRRMLDSRESYSLIELTNVEYEDEGPPSLYLK